MGKNNSFNKVKYRNGCDSSAEMEDVMRRMVFLRKYIDEQTIVKRDPSKQLSASDSQIHRGSSKIIVIESRYSAS